MWLIIDRQISLMVLQKYLKIEYSKNINHYNYTINKLNKIGEFLKNIYGKGQNI